MGESAAETVREIEATRGRLEEEFRELEHRMPAPAVWTKRLVGVAVGGGAGGAAFWFVVKRLRARRKKKKEVLSPAPVQAVVQVLPERWADALGKTLEDGEWRTWLGIAGGVWLLFRLAELRQLRRMNRAMALSGR